MNVLETMKQALAALGSCRRFYVSGKEATPIKTLDAITNLRAAIEQMEKQEPVGVLAEDVYGRGQVFWYNKPNDRAKIYTHPAPAVPECTWVLDNTDAFYSTKCNNAFILNDGTPEENDMRFCPYCGGTLKVETDFPWEDTAAPEYKEQ